MRYDPGILVTEGPAAKQFHCSRGHSWSIADMAAGPHYMVTLPGIEERWCAICLGEFLEANVGKVLDGPIPPPS